MSSGILIIPPSGQAFQQFLTQRILPLGEVDSKRNPVWPGNAQAAFRYCIDRRALRNHHSIALIFDWFAPSHPTAYRI